MKPVVDTKNKSLWLSLLLVAIVLFICGLQFNNAMFSLGALVLSAFVYIKGNPIIFKEYDAKRKAKLAESKKVKDAVGNTLRNGTLFKKHSKDTNK